MSIETAREAAARGAALLDEKDPGWRDRIDRDELDLRLPCGCIIGQDFGQRFCEAPEDLSGDLDDPYVFGLHVLGLNYEDEATYGFVAPSLFGTNPNDASWDELQEAWVEILAATP